MTDITRKRGDTYAEEVLVVDSAGAAVDITGYSFTLTVDPSKAPVDSSNNVLSLAGVITDAAGGAVEFAPSDVQADITPARYWYDIQMVDAAGRKKTIQSGRFTIEQDITK